MGVTSIEWTDKVWNPVTGCTKVSPGCLNCYAEALDKRFHATWTGGEPHVRWTVAAQRKAEGSVAVLTELENSVGLGQPVAPYRPVAMHFGRLREPERWPQPSRVFVNSMSDLFHEAVPMQFIAQVFGAMLNVKRHRFQVLTKRPKRMLEFMTGYWAGWFQEQGCNWPPENVWLGVSVENQRYADERIPILAQVPAAIRFLSCEPLLGPVDLSRWLRGSASCETCGRPRTVIDEDGCCTMCGADAQIDWGPLSWVIVGGESGPGARPMNLQWARDIVRQCKGSDVPVFAKQLGAKPVTHPPLYPDGIDLALFLKDRKGGDPAEWPEDLRVRQFPQEAA